MQEQNACQRRYKAMIKKHRCRWAGSAPEFPAYHDTEWGFPVDDDQRLFEKICLEGFQSGLSWRTILVKRENFRDAFAGFDFYQVAKFRKREIDRLVKNTGIIRHRGKIEATVNNAQRAIEMVDEHGSLAAYFWQFEPDPASLGEPQSVTTSDEAIALSKALKKLGWKFVGPTTVYSFMQAMGLVNDHVHDCFVRAKVDKKRRAFKPPGAR